MELRDGFITGVFNYCDRWCERCALTSRCRVFADVATRQAADDPNFRDLAELEERDERERLQKPVPAWMAELIEEMNDAAEEVAKGNVPKRPEMAPEHVAVQARAEAYMMAVSRWLRGQPDDAADVDPLATIAHDHVLITGKVHRALMGLADGIEPDEWPSDADGSAKVALLAIDRSRAAWKQVRDGKPTPPGNVERYAADLERLAADLERLFPKARAFVRPGFDEPEAVSRMQLAEGW